MALPAVSYLDQNTRTEGEMKVAFEDQLKGIKQVPGAGVAEQALTLATDTITPALGASGVIAVDTEAAAAADNLATIAQTNCPDGTILLIGLANAAHVVTVKHLAGGTGQISLRSTADLVMSLTTQWLMVKRTGTLWEEIWRSGGEAFLNMTGGINDAKTTIASATTPDIFAITVGNTINYTGSVLCTGFVASPQAGPSRTLVCAGGAPFTAGATMIIAGLVSGQSVTCAVNDEVTVLAFTTTEFHLSIKKRNGQAIGTPINQFGKQIYGLTWDPGTDAVNDVNINTGGAADSTSAYWMSPGTAMGKQTDVAWAVGGTVGAPAGGLDTGAVGNNGYYIWLIARSDTGAIDALFSLSSTAPTMPANYDYKRLIGYVLRVGGTLVAWHTYETEGGGIKLNWDVPTLDINLANTLTTTRRTDAVKVPLTFTTVAHLNVALSDVGSLFQAWIYCPDQTDAAPSTSVAPLANASLQVVTSVVEQQMFVRTSSAGTIAARATLATVDSYQVSTMGFRWSRRTY
jgi:hypothetical protein